MRVILLNAFAPSMLDFTKRTQWTIVFTRITLSQLKELVDRAREVRSFIRHPATLDVINRLLNLKLAPSSELYRYSEGDEIVVITLKKPVRGQEVEVKEEDLLVLKLEVR